MATSRIFEHGEILTLSTALKPIKVSGIFLKQSLGIFKYALIWKEFSSLRQKCSMLLDAHLIVTKRDTMKENERLSETGFVRLPTFPISKNNMVERVKTDRFPKSVKLGPDITTWRAESIKHSTNVERETAMRPLVFFGYLIYNKLLLFLAQLIDA